ncbi:MAG: hypothetical protein V2B20_27810 [Pseudomonadota bacterium]
MLQLKALSIIFGSIFLAAVTTSADVVLPAEPNRLFRSWIEIFVPELPLGYALFCVGENGKIIGQTNGKTELRIYQPCTVYGAREDQLSSPFSFQADKMKLVQLRTVRQEEIPEKRGEGPGPQRLHCKITGERLEDYTLQCDTTLQESRKWPRFPPIRVPVKP